MKKILIAGVVVLLVGAGVAAAFLRGGAATPTTPTTQPAPVAAEENLVAEARVVPVHSAALNVPSGGIIAEMLVAEGDHVQAGQALLRLDRARALAMVGQAEAQLAQAQATAAQLRAGATPEEIAAAEAQLRAAEAQLRQTGGSVTSADHAAAQAQIQQAQAQLAELRAGPKRTDLQAATAALAQAQANLVNQRDQLSATKTNAQLQVQQRADDLTKAQAAYATALQNWQYVQDTGQDPITPWLGTDPKTGKKIPNKLADAQRQQYYDAFVQAEATMHSAEAAVQQAQVAYDTARQSEVSGIQVAEQQVASAQASLDKLLAGADAADLAAARAQLASSQAGLDKLVGEQRGGALAAAQAAVDQAQANLDKLRAGVSKSDLAVAAAQVQSAEAALKLAQVAVAEAELRAPFAGTVAALDAQLGEYAAPGTPIMQLADLSAWQIETTDLTELNILGVREGSPTTVTFDAIPGLELKGKVSHIRALGENKQGDITYVVTITLDQQDPRLRWNMTASVEIAP
jgi:HlyD family secretion protein